MIYDDILQMFIERYHANNMTYYKPSVSRGSGEQIPMTTLLLGEWVHDTTILLLAVIPHRQTRLCVTYIDGKLKDRLFDPKRLRLYENADVAI